MVPSPARAAGFFLFGYFAHSSLTSSPHEAKLSQGNVNAANFKASAKGLAGDSNDFLLYNTTTGALLYDADGSGSGSAIQFATLENKAGLKASDFMMVG